MSIYWATSFMLPKRTVVEINRLCRNFLWSGPDCINSRALIGWDDLLFPFDEGGLSIRDLSMVNNTAVLRHVWSIVSIKNIVG